MKDIHDKALIRSVLLDLSDTIRHVVQAGACDGVYYDFYYPLYQIFKWPTTFIEPHPELFKKLKETYPLPAHCVNKALDTTKGFRVLWQDIDKEYGRSSFYPEYCYSPDRKPILVATTTWDEVMREDTDLVITDCEGHDEVLIPGLLGHYNPRCIIWERVKVKDFDRLIQILEQHGYENVPGDTGGCNYISLRE